MHKVCKKCNKEVNIENFGFYSKNKIRNICKKCVSIYMRSYQKNNKKKMVEIAQRYRKNNREVCKKRDAEHYLKNKEEKLQKSLLWQKNNKEKARARNARRRALKNNACPEWVDLGKIKDIYENCPKGHHVDHIVPLKNKMVCGLHVPWNLQYLPARENLRKHNSFEFKEI